MVGPLFHPGIPWFRSGNETLICCIYCYVHVWTCLNCRWTWLILTYIIYPYPIIHAGTCHVCDDMLSDLNLKYREKHLRRLLFSSVIATLRRSYVCQTVKNPDKMIISDGCGGKPFSMDYSSSLGKVQLLLFPPCVSRCLPCLSAKSMVLEFMK